MARFDSILFTHPRLGGVDDLTPPDCFDDLHLDQIVRAMILGNENLDGSSWHRCATWTRSPTAMRYSATSNTMRPATIEAFVKACAPCTAICIKPARFGIRLQKQGWFVHAVGKYCPPWHRCARI